MCFSIANCGVCSHCFVPFCIKIFLPFAHTFKFPYYLQSSLIQLSITKRICFDSASPQLRLFYQSHQIFVAVQRVPWTIHGCAAWIEFNQFFLSNASAMKPDFSSAPNRCFIFIFSFSKIGSSCGMVGKHAVALTDVVYEKSEARMTFIILMWPMFLWIFIEL